MSGIAPSIGPRRFRDTLGHYASGITVVTGVHDDEPVGFTCQSFCSVSIDPPLVSFSVMRTSTSYPRIAERGRFAVNILAHDQDHISQQFARRDTDKWAGVEWASSAAGNPVIRNTLMWVDCETWAEHEAGDHLIVVGRVCETSAQDSTSSEPLLYFKGAYRRLRDISP
ncbi:flavin reductase family protein [Agromyces intestinalis]|uniref:Flavin reductase family protein n=1 Tax=Agromyces intestinalis TaxID=2592652 RepID=A0A5C1YHX2_9MICO|nr:flavin reductase family protein [Agromyces intestinalis]QEO14637.1 flavin reductase family protein [Agromyces intestinalis]